MNQWAVRFASSDTRRQVVAVALPVAWSVLCVVMTCTTVLDAQESATQRQSRQRLREPVYRISSTATSASNERESAAATVQQEARQSHPLDHALDLARASLTHIDSNIRDYTCTLVKRERVHGELLDYEFMRCKVRHEQQLDASLVPFGVYLSFLKPDSMKGREVIYVEGRNNGKIVAHEGGLKGRFLPTVQLLPTSTLALRGNRYPITEVGIRTLTLRLIEKGERDRQLGHCHVRIVDGAKVRDRACKMLEVKHDDYDPKYDFHLARVFLDTEMNIPIRYEAYDWPAKTGADPQLIEEYTYLDVKLNVGLEDTDFDQGNPGYNF